MSLSEKRCCRISRCSANFPKDFVCRILSDRGFVFFGSRFDSIALSLSSLFDSILFRMNNILRGGCLCGSLMNSENCW